VKLGLEKVKEDFVCEIKFPKLDIDEAILSE